jgi:hypothetical protein
LYVHLNWSLSSHSRHEAGKEIWFARLGKWQSMPNSTRHRGARSQQGRARRGGWGRACDARAIHAVLMPRCVPCCGVQHVYVVQPEAWHVAWFVCKLCSGRARPLAGAMCGVCAASLASKCSVMRRAMVCWERVGMQHAANPEAWQVERKHAAPSWWDVARGATFARNMCTACRAMRAPRAMRACGVGQAGVMGALASRGQHVPAAREGFLIR